MHSYMVHKIPEYHDWGRYQLILRYSDRGGRSIILADTLIEHNMHWSLAVSLD